MRYHNHSSGHYRDFFTKLPATMLSGSFKSTQNFLKKNINQSHQITPTDASEPGTIPTLKLKREFMFFILLKSLAGRKIVKSFILLILLIVLAPSAFAEKNTGITLRHNYQKPGGDYSNFYVKDVQECSKRCLQEQRCKAFDFHTSDKSCWLKEKSYPARKYHGCISGTKEFASTPTTSNTPEIKQYSSHVKSVQKLLAKYNYNPGPADGVLGKKTEQALKKYQKVHKLPVTGKIDEATLIAMKLIKPTKAKK